MQPSVAPQEWQELNGYDASQAQAFTGGYQGEWQDYHHAEQLACPEQYLQANMQGHEVQAGPNIPQDPRYMTPEEKDRGLGSVFKRGPEASTMLVRRMLVRRILISFLRVTLNVILVIDSTTERMLTVMMKMTCQKWIWEDEQRVVFIGGTLKPKRNGQHTMNRRKQWQRLLSSLV